MIYINISLHRTQLKSSVSIPVMFTAWAVVTVDVQFTKQKKPDKDKQNGPMSKRKKTIKKINTQTTMENKKQNVTIKKLKTTQNTDKLIKGLETMVLMSKIQKIKGQNNQNAES